MKPCSSLGQRFHVLQQLLPGSSRAAGNSFLQGSCNSHSSWSGSSTGRSLPPSATTRARQGTECPGPSLSGGADFQKQRLGPAIARSPAAPEDLQLPHNSLPEPFSGAGRGDSTLSLVKRPSSPRGQSGAIPQAGDGGAEPRAPLLGGEQGDGLTPGDRDSSRQEEQSRLSPSVVGT